MGARTAEPADDDVTDAELLEDLTNAELLDLLEAPVTPEEKAFLDQRCSDPGEILARVRRRMLRDPQVE